MFVLEGTTNKWTYNLTDHSMIYLETIIALAPITYVVDLNAYELHPGDEIKSSLTLLLNAKVIHYTYDTYPLLFKSIFVDLC